MNMNWLHRRICSSAGWASFVEESLLPEMLDGVNLGPDVLEIGAMHAVLQYLRYYGDWAAGVLAGGPRRPDLRAPKAGGPWLALAARAGAPPPPASGWRCRAGPPAAGQA